MKIFLLLLLLFELAFSNDFNKFQDAVVKGLKNYEKIDSYISMNSQKERIEDKLIIQKGIIFKYKKPHLVYMKKISNPDKNSEVIYNKAVYGDKIVYHAGGFLGAIPINLDPKGSLVKKGNRHLIYDAGIGHILDLLKKTSILLKSSKNGRVAFIDSSVKNGEKLDNYVIVGNDSQFYAPLVKVSFRKKDYLPVFISVYDKNDSLIEEYYFKNLDYSKKISSKEFLKDFDGYSY